ncbi:MAG: nuclear transport factor 2 family protein [Candidatus Binatia bacterium]
MDDAERVLAANAAFYAAFAGRDADAMDALWAARAPVACIHPGWHILRGRDPVMASWLAILSGPASPAIRCANAVAHVLGDSAFVTCTEHIPGALLVATNVFVREDGEWRMAHHQAGGVAHIAASDPHEQMH